MEELGLGTGGLMILQAAIWRDGGSGGRGKIKGMFDGDGGREEWRER